LYFLVVIRKNSYCTISKRVLKKVVVYKKEKILSLIATLDFLMPKMSV